jgi:hypothetical protein
VRFIDPNGEYEIDIENGTIKSNLNDINDMKEANRLYLNKFPSFKSIATDDATGISVTFNSPKDMRDFLFNNPDGIDVSALKSLFDNLGTESVIASLAADALNNAGLSRAATGISITALAADINKARKNLNPDTVSDIVIDVIGFKTPEGLLLNAGLTVGKQAGKWYVEKLSESLVGFAYSTFLSDPIFR